MNDIDFLTVSACDCCGRRGHGRMYHDRGVPVFFSCRTCAGSGYEVLARRDIEAWLAGSTGTHDSIALGDFEDCCSLGTCNG